eukprot:10645450-Ditylum_brightwellii.AAC.1
MTTANGETAANGHTGTAVYHTGFNHPPDGEQRKNDNKGQTAAKDQKKGQSFGMNMREKMKKKINNNAPEDTDVPMEYQDPEQAMNLAATNAVSAKTCYNYMTNLDFPVPEKADSFELRKNYVNLMQALLTADREIMIDPANSKSKKKWSTTQELPSGKAFNKSFAVKPQKARFG